MSDLKIELVSRLMEEDKEPLFEMANLTPKRTGLKVVIWSEQQGFTRNKPDNEKRFKIDGNDFSLSLSLEKEPKILAQSGKIKQSDKLAIKEAIDYVVRNLDLFLKHYNSTPFEFDDDDLKEALRERGDYK